MALQGVAWRNLLKGLVLAGPLLFFPFARSYYVFYVLILVLGFQREGLTAIWRGQQGLRLALLATLLPILITTVALLLSTGSVERSWLDKIGLFLLAGLLGLATTGLARDDSTRQTAQLLITIAVLSWLADGTLQMLTGTSISGRLPSLHDSRLTAYFTHPTKFGYFAGMMALFPATWCLSRRWGFLGGCAVLALAGVLTMAGGSRFGMITYLFGVAVFVMAGSLALPARQRWAIWVVAPVLGLLALTALDHLNPMFHARLAQTAQLFTGTDYATLNNATTGRLDIWFPAVQLARDHWLFGVGPGSFTEAVKPYLAPDNLYVLAHIDILHTHQVLLETWVATGVIGLAAFLGLYGWLSWRLLKTAAQRTSPGWAALLVFLLMWFPLGTQHNFYSSEMAFLSFYLLGLAFGWLRTPEAGPAPAARD